MPDQVLFMRTLSEFAQALVRRYEVADVLYDMAGRLIEVLDLAGAGVSLADGDRIRFVTGANEATVKVEEAQEAAQEGPCVQAWRTGQPVLVSDIRQPLGRWDAYRAAATHHGFVAVAAIPMKLEARTLGALNLYATRVREWREDELAVARVMADVATSYIINASELDKAERTARQLQEALESRIVIEQAKGMLASERRTSPDDAFRVLRAHARRHNTGLRAVAEAVVHLGLRPE